MRKQWPDGNRREVAARYARAASMYKQELLKEHEGTSRQKEAVAALQGLNPWGKRGCFEEIVRWLGEFDSARTLLEEWPVMKRWVDGGQSWVLGGWTGDPSAWRPIPEWRAPRFGEREVGGAPPPDMRVWMPLVAAWEKGREGLVMGGGVTSTLWKEYPTCAPQTTGTTGKWDYWEGRVLEGVLGVGKGLMGRR